MTVFTVALDPGIRHCGVALFLSNRLVRAGLARNPEATLRGPAAWMTMARAVEDMLAAWLPEEGFVGGDELILAAELQQVYRGPAAKADPDDLFQLTGVVGAVTALVNTAVGYLPRTWKKNVPKVILEGRIRKRLNPEELKAMNEAEGSTPSLQHNVIDAVGIGLHHFLRLRPLKRGAT